MASKRHQRRRACEGKVSYETIEDATDAARKYRHDFGQRLTPYRCKWCGNYHVGHPPRHVRRAIAQRRMRQ